MSIDWLASLPPSLRAACSVFEPQFARWVEARSGDAALAGAALALALAQAAGHVGLTVGEAGSLSELPDHPGVDSAALAASPWVATDSGTTPRPFVFERGRFYSWRQWQAEVRVAAALQQRLAAPTAVPPAGLADAVAAALLPAVVAGTHDPASDQRQALLQGAGRALFALTGGPGTGKTATVLKLLLLAQLSTSQPLRIALAAPTGKAAQRLAQAMLSGKLALRARADLPADWLRALTHLPEQALTVHRLLGIRPTSALEPADEAPARLPLDLLVVDEASMLDLELMDLLLAQLEPETRLLLLGDADQLSAVGAGSILADLVSTAVRDPRHAGPAVGRLTHVWRAGGALVELAGLVRSGNVDAALALLASRAATGVSWAAIDQAGALVTRLRHWALQPDRPLLSAAPDPGDPAAALAALQRWRILCAVREGPFGMLAINRWLGEWTSSRCGQRGELWFHGRVVMVTRNQPLLGLANGDVGICLRAGAAFDGPPQVWFEAEDGSTGPRAFVPRQLPEHEDAWAMTVHKSQGSEYDEVILVLPPDPAHRLLRRELFYTGATRARQTLEVWAGEAALRTAIGMRSARSSGLGARLLGSA